MLVALLILVYLFLCTMYVSLSVSVLVHLPLVAMCLSVICDQWRTERGFRGVALTPTLNRVFFLNIT